MYEVSEAFKRAVRRHQVVDSFVEVLDRGEVVATLYPLSGDVQMESGGDVQRSLSTAFADPLGAITPASYADILAPNGNEVRAWRGFTTLPDEMIPVFTGKIDEVDIESGSEGGVYLSVSAFDRAMAVSESGFETTYVVAEGTNYADAIRDLVDSRLPGLTFRFIDTPAVTPLLVFGPKDDPWKKASEMAESIGCRLYFDGLGTCVLEPVPVIDETEPVWVYAEEQFSPQSTLLSAKKKLTRQYTYNGVIATGETPSITDQAAAPVTAVVWDDNPTSPTYYEGKFGRKPREYASSFLTTPEQAASAARAILQYSLGLAELVSFDAIVNPAHVPGDIVSVEVEKSKIGDRFVMDSFSIPLTYSDNLSASCRRRSTG